MDRFGRRPLSLLIAAAIGFSLANSNYAQSNEIEFAIPSAPQLTSARVTDSGIRVSWKPPPSANPPVTHYVVTGGPGSCPVTVSADARYAVMPILEGEKSIVPSVYAVNSYGQSDLDSYSKNLSLSAPKDSIYTNVQLLELSDFHGALEGTSRNFGAALLASAWADDRAKVANTLTLSAGDNIGASPPISSLFDEAPTIEALGLMGLDYSTFGNHEHDRPLAALRQTINDSDFEWVVSNYSSLTPLTGATNAAKEFAIAELDGVSVGIVGINTSSTADLVAPSNLTYGRKTLAIASGVQPMNKAAKKALRAGADIVIGLAHEGWDENLNGNSYGQLLDLAGESRNIDVLYGGHTHQPYTSMVGDMPVIQVARSGVEYTRTQLCINTFNGEILGTSTEMITREMLDGLTPDPSVSKLVFKYEELIDRQLGEVLGQINGQFPRGGIPEVERSGQTPMGDYLADALRDKYNTQLALINGGSIRDTLPAGGYTPLNKSLSRPSATNPGPYDITLGDIRAVFPFENSAVRTTIDGEHLWQALENGLTGYPANGAFPQISGFRFTFNPDLPESQRVLSVTLQDGTLIERNEQKYSVVTNDYLVNGGDSYVGMFAIQDAIIGDLIRDLLAQAIRADMASTGSVTPPLADGRITIVR